MASRALATSKVRQTSSARRRGMRSVVVLAVGACTLALAIVSAIGRSPSPSHADEVTAFQAAIQAPIQHWGKVEVLGMRPAMSDLRSGTGVPAGAIGQEARAWQSAFSQIGQQLDAAAVPSALTRAMTLFKQALDQYTHAAASVEQAATTDGPARQQLLNQAVAQAQHGDCVYDDAGMEIQNARRSAGLVPTLDYPDHPCSSSGP